MKSALLGRPARAGLALCLVAAVVSGCGTRSPRKEEPKGYPELGTIDPWQDQLGARTLADRGTLLRAVHAATIPQAVVSQSPFFLPALGPAKNGYELFVIQYVSEGRRGIAAAVSALLYLPSGTSRDVPIIAIDHGAWGVGPTCGPSHIPLLTDPFAIPFVGRGYAVLAPDYAGMGVDNGMSSFLVGTAEAAATLDGLRALRSFHDPRFDARRLGTDFFVAGHSQGGHAALFTHQLFDPSIGVRLLGSVAIAPGLGSARAWSKHFNDEARPVGGVETAAAASLYSHALHLGGPDAAKWLLPAAQKTMPELLHDVCQPQLPGFFWAAFPTVGALYQPSFISAAAACNFDGPCPGFEPWASALIADEPGRITSSVPSLVLQGLADAVVEPAATACIVERMKARNTPVDACAYVGADHVTVLDHALPVMVRWIVGRRAGQTLDVCAARLAPLCSAR